MPRKHKAGDITTAHHEAGHAIAWCALGVGHYIEFATLDSEKLLSCAYVRVHFGLVRMDRPEDADRIGTIAKLAGPLAQRKYKPRSDWRAGGIDDFKTATELAGERLDDWTKQAEVLVEEHWTTIEKLAGLLLEYRTVDRFTILDVFEGRDPEGLGDDTPRT